MKGSRDVILVAPPDSARLLRNSAESFDGLCAVAWRQTTDVPNDFIEHAAKA